MEIPVLIEHVAGNGFRVTGTTPFPFAVEGATREDALRKVQDLVARREAQGAEIATVQVRRSQAPWSSFAGSLRDDPTFDAWQAAIQEHRRQIDEEGPDLP